MQALVGERKAGKYRDLTAQCDYDSIMMYEVFLKAAKRARHADPPSPKTLANDPDQCAGTHLTLSVGDALSIRTLYEIKTAV